MEIIDIWRLIKCLNYLLLVILDLCLCIFGVNSVFFQKCFIIDRVESYWGIYVYGNRSFCLDFFCMNIDVYYFNGLI